MIFKLSRTHSGAATAAFWKSGRDISPAVASLLGERDGPVAQPLRLRTKSAIDSFFISEIFGGLFASGSFGLPLLLDKLQELW